MWILAHQKQQQHQRSALWTLYDGNVRQMTHRFTSQGDGNAQNVISWRHHEWFASDERPESLLTGMTEASHGALVQWRHNGRDGVSNLGRLGGFLNRLFRRRSKKTSKFRVTGLCEGNSPVTGEFPSQRASNAENVSSWWRHHVKFVTSCTETVERVGCHSDQNDVRFTFDFGSFDRRFCLSVRKTSTQFLTNAVYTSLEISLSGRITSDYLQPAVTCRRWKLQRGVGVKYGFERNGWYSLVSVDISRYL